MKEYVIEDAIRALIGVQLTEEKAREILKQAFSDEIMIVWNVDDIQTQASNEGRPISYDHAVDILHRIEDNHDANVGVNWGVISEYLKEG